MATQLYTKSGEKLVPITDASAVTVKNDKFKKTTGKLDSDLQYLDERINSITDENEEFQSGLNITVKYYSTESDSESYIKDITDSQFSTSFILPNAENRYTWKKTTFSLSGQQDKIIYEIVATYPIPYKSQTIYKVSANQEVDDFVYPQEEYEEDGETKYKDDYNGFSFDDNPGWLTYPTSLSITTPYLIMSLRETDEDGKWKAFSPPAVIGYWSFNS